MIANGDIFLIEGGRVVTYHDLHTQIEVARRDILARGPPQGLYVVEAENSLTCYIRFLALLAERRPVLLAPDYQFADPAYRELLATESGSALLFWAGSDELSPSEAKGPGRIHPLIQAACEQWASPFLVRTSGSSGAKYKFVLHDARRFTERFLRIPPYFHKTLAFSPLESIAGIEVLLETAAYGRTLVAAGDRLSPSAVAKLIAENQIDYFQTTPTFLNLMLLAREIRVERLGSLALVAYGSEPSQKAALQAIQKELPGAKLKHTYGMSEVGILKTFTDPEDPTLLRFDVEFNEAKVVDGLLEVKSPTVMLGYLNYPNEERVDGWFRTNDAVSQEGSFLRVKGRADDTLNVAGRKFFPSELEDLILEVSNIADVTVSRERNDLVGELIVAQIVLESPEDEDAFRVRFKKHCESRVPYFMHPHRVRLVEDIPVNSRSKRIRRR